jgi:tRNA G18 (ribose-2'-O)-methylase SpoU
VGGILRNALAFGVEQVLLSPRSVDPLYRKSLRVSMGAALRVPFCRAPAWPEELDALRAAGFRLLALDAGRGAASLAPGDAVPTCGPRRLLLLVGNEGEGLSPAVLARADARVAIPMADGIDSLNAATATGIALHAIAAALEIV